MLLSMIMNKEPEVWRIIVLALGSIGIVWAIYIIVSLVVDYNADKKKTNEVIKEKQADKEINNVYLTRFDIERIFEIAGKEDKIERIYINFCNPWPKAKHKKKRLTHTKQLEHYKEFLKSGSEIYFKTDDDGLFEDSLQYFKDCGFEIIKSTYNLHREDILDGKNIITEHEKMFSDEGIKIKALIAKLK